MNRFFKINSGNMFMFTSENIDTNNIYLAIHGVTKSWTQLSDWTELKSVASSGLYFPSLQSGGKKSDDPLIPFLKGIRTSLWELKLFTGFIVPAVPWSSLLIQGNDKAYWHEVVQHSRVFVGFCFVLNCICSNSNNFLIPSCRKISIFLTLAGRGGERRVWR